jgi:hypothetical protein
MVNSCVAVEFMFNFSILQSFEKFSETCTNNSKFDKFIEKYKIVTTSNRKRVNQEKCIMDNIVDITDDR